jgi:hypothetical protein
MLGDQVFTGIPSVLVSLFRISARMPGRQSYLPENVSMTRLRAAYSHSIPDRPPIQVAPGERVRAGRRDTEWPEFVFVTTGEGAGWVPGRCLDTSSDPAVVLVGYDTTELATTAGEELILVVQDDPSGWAWVRNSADLEGWVPLRSLAPLPGA